MRRFRQWWGRQRRGTRGAAGFGAAVLLVGTGLTAALLSSGGASSAAPAVAIVTMETTRPALSGNSRSEPPPIESKFVSQRDCSGRSAAIRSIQELTEACGDPPDARMGRLRIPTMGVDAPLSERTVGPDGEMPLPAGPADVAWYDFDAPTGLGGRPGQSGNAILAGHLDYADPVPYAKVNYRGRGVFYGLGLLSAGDEVEVEMDGKLLRYAVTWRKNVSANGGDWAALMSSNVGGDSLTLITCGGDFDPRTREYSERVVVRAARL